ncbi:unnamed protein product [Rotaria socialis]|uniref:F-box domain-containing protein n=1 Tax=Rotaria socialis TaxID=392032 RepID=A0A820R2W1_9BILA|nr:unnamed protein product [Rotaria socialis]CAF4434457.1 unnamed protein product [Rotaria socialis]
MKQIKRRRNNIIHDNNYNKRKKIDVTANETDCLIKDDITTLENLSNELIYEIFEFLNYHHAFQAFYDLNQRFQDFFLNSNLPIKINISSMSKSKLQQYLTHIIKPYAYRIEFFRLSNPFIDLSLLLLPIMKTLTQLTTLILNNIESNYIEQIVNHLSSLPVLSSLIIISINTIKNPCNIYYKIFHLPILKYCQILIELLQCPKSLHVATNEFSTIEHLIINHEISIDQLPILLSYVPQLRRLSIGNLKEPKLNRNERGSVTLNYLTNVSLKLHNVNFDDFESLVTNYFRQIQVLTIAIQYIGLYGNSTQYLNAHRWEQLIATHMLNLSVFDFQLSYRGIDSNDERQAFETLINKFNSKFWIEHQWFFDHHYHQITWSNAAVFYSRNPHRRKDYVLYDELVETIWSSRFDINEDPIHHICIHSKNMIKKSIDNFPNATKLTFCETFEVPRDSITIDFNRLLKLKKLTKLTIECHHFSFEQLIELLQFAPNVHALKLDSIILYRTDSVSIQQKELSKLVSNMNTITKVTISKEITLEKIQLLTTVFPRMEYLTINLYKQDLQPIAQYLLSKSNSNTRYLSSLCISKQRNDLITTLKTLIKSKKLLHDYTLKVINRKLYLWW